MTQHLDDRQILALANGEYVPDAARHAADCAHCSGQLRQLTSSLELFSETMQAMPAWRLRPIEINHGRPALKWAAALAATAAMAATFMVFESKEKARQAEEMARQDAVLMDQLFHGTARVTPASFERFNNLGSVGQLGTTEGNLQ